MVDKGGQHGWHGFENPDGTPIVDAYDAPLVGKQLARWVGAYGVRPAYRQFDARIEVARSRLREYRQGQIGIGVYHLYALSAQAQNRVSAGDAKAARGGVERGERGGAQVGVARIHLCLLHGLSTTEPRVAKIGSDAKACEELA